MTNGLIGQIQEAGQRLKTAINAVKRVDITLYPTDDDESVIAELRALMQFEKKVYPDGVDWNELKHKIVADVSPYYREQLPLPVIYVVPAHDDNWKFVLTELKADCHSKIGIYTIEL